MTTEIEKLAAEIAMEVRDAAYLQEAGFRGSDFNLKNAAATIATHLAPLVEERDKFKSLSTPGRLTDDEYKNLGSPDGWTWLKRVRMWARLDQDHVDSEAALLRLREAAQELFRTPYFEMTVDNSWANRLEQLRAALAFNTQEDNDGTKTKG
jgi:hypothetical protein